MAVTDPDARSDTHPAARTTRRRIVLIEDDADAAEAFALLLQLFGHEVRVAHDGRSGLVLARELRPDIVFCDIGLPDIDGYAVARALRRDEHGPCTRLIALTGCADADHRRHAHDAGFDAYIAKPADPNDILRRLE